VHCYRQSGSWLSSSTVDGAEVMVHASTPNSSPAYLSGTRQTAARRERKEAFVLGAGRGRGLNRCSIAAAKLRPMW